MSGAEIENLALNFRSEEVKIMVVDDVFTNVLLLKKMLESQGYQVVSSQDPVKSIDMILEECPDLILLDVMMPVMDGFEVARTLKAKPETQDIPIIFLTALDNKESLVEGFACGGSDYVAKPFEREVLLARVRSQLVLTSARKQIVRQNEELRATIQSRDKLYSVIAHDLRSPLGAVQMCIKVLEDLCSPEQIGEELYGMIVDSNRQISDLFMLLDNLLKWTKSQVGRMMVVAQDFVLEDILKTAVNMYSRVAVQKNIRLINKNTDTHTLVCADVDMCKTILRNLISNAIKFSMPDSEIEVYVREEGDMAVLSVKDFGCGMTEEEQNNLFHYDTHFSKFGTQREEGSGLGLIVCKDFSEKFGGKLTLTSVVGKGSTFNVYIPLKK